MNGFKMYVGWCFAEKLRLLNAASFRDAFWRLGKNSEVVKNMTDACIKLKNTIQSYILFQKIGVVETNTLWHFRLPSRVETPINIASILRLAGTGITLLILCLPLLNCRTIVCLSSLL